MILEYIAMIIVLAVLLVGRAYISGTVTQRFAVSTGTFAVASLDGIVLIELLVILGVLVILQSVAPLVGVFIAGVTSGAVLAWTARSVPS